MLSKSIKKFVSMMIVLLIAVSGCIIPVNAISYDPVYDITIANVTKNYGSIKNILDQCNELRAEKNLPKWVMDKSTMERAMKRATELSIYTGFSSLDGTSSYGNENIIIGYGLFGFNSFINVARENDKENVEDVIFSYNKTVGIGAVEVAGVKYAYVIVTNKVADEVDESVYDQGRVTENVPTKCLKSYLVDSIELSPKENSQIYCGSTVSVYMKVKNKKLIGAYAYLTQDCITVTSSDSRVFAVSGEKIYAMTPGLSVIRAKFKKDSDIFGKSLIKSVAVNFDGYEISDIPDQRYTGKAIEPEIEMIFPNGSKLKQGTDYTVSYENNISVGIATARITGINKYYGSTKTKNFRIVSNPDVEYKASLKASHSTISVNEQLKLVANNSLDDKTTKYSFDYSPYEKNNWKSIVSESSTNTCDFKPTTSGKYIVRVTAKNSSGMIATASTVINVVPQLVCNAKVSSNKIVLGNYIKINANCTGGVSPLTYAYYIKKSTESSWKLIKDYSSSNSVNYKSTSLGEYTVRVKCKSSTGLTVQKDIAVSVIKSSLVNKSTISATTVNLGDTVMLKGSATGGTSPYQYIYYYKKPSSSTWTKIKDYSTSTSANIKPARTGKYDVCIKVKDAKGTVENKYFTVNVKAPLTNKSTVSATTIDLGSTVTLKGSATGGTSPYQYIYYYKKSSTSKWATIKDYSTSTSANIKPASTGKYDVCIKVKDAKNKIEKKYFIVTVK